MRAPIDGWTPVAAMAGLLLSMAGCDTGPPPIPPRPDSGPAMDSGMDAGDAEPMCDNGMRDGTESGVDCGGDCPACENGAPCAADDDCVSLVCRRGFCLIPSCRDGVRNGGETGTDCGGDCGLCPAGEPCTSNDQCISARCRGGMCAMSTCEDGRLNADETDIDCGGPRCAACDGGDDCGRNEDCRSLICATDICTDSGCSDRVQNQDETSVDCGGAVCPGCRDGLACVIDSDCEGRRCLDGGCVSCMDRTQNAEETDIDCGGGLCDGCRDGFMCIGNSDCVSNRCLSGECISCSDGVMNGGETDIDCGGTACAGCFNGRTCLGNSDCLSFDCVGGLCRGIADTCTDAFTLTTGRNTIGWVATSNDHFVTNPPCTSTARSGPDLVFRYTATVDGFLTYDIVKPTRTRWILMVSDRPCGTTTPERVCQYLPYTETFLRGQFAVTAGTTYFFYLIDTTTGAAPLSNPINITIDEIVPPCTAGMGGVVGAGITRRATGISFLSEYYLRPDASPTGYVYIGGTSDLYRVPKAGGALENVELMAGITSTPLGTEFAVAGNDIFAVDTRTTGATLRLTRISSDGGSSWISGGQDYATFNMGATQPNDDFRGAAADPGNTRLYLITHEATLNSEIWSVPLGSATVPVTGRLEGAIPNQYCSGLAVDSTYFYTACNRLSSTIDQRIVRVHRTTFAVDSLTTTVPVHSTMNSIWADDTNADGVADALYVNVGTEEAYFVCGLGGTPFAAAFVSWGAATSNYGLGFDPAANRLYGYDDDTRELIIIE